MARPSVIASVPTTTLHAELRRRERLATSLARMRDRLQTKIVAIDARIADWGGTGNGAPKRSSRAPKLYRAGGQGSRGPRPGSLTSVLRDALKGKTMSIAEAARAARKAGYRTKGKDFRAHVFLALRSNGHIFRRVRRGMYTVA